MTEERNEPRRIESLLNAQPQGLSIQEIAEELNIHRNSASKYLAILHLQGKVDIRPVGKAKLYTLSHRIPFSAVSLLCPHYLVTFDRQMHVSHVNDPFLTFLSATRKEVLGKPFRNLPFPPVRSPEFEKCVDDALMGKKGTQSLEFKMRNNEYQFALQFIPTVFDNGTSGVSICIKDVTEFKKHAELADLWEKRYRMVSEDQTEYILRFRPDHTISFINDAYAGILGKKKEDFLGKKYRPLIPEEDQQRLTIHFKNLSCTNPVATIEHRAILPDGSVRWHRWTDRVICNDDTIIEYHSVGIDITDFKLKEIQLHKYHENLEEMIREKTGELQEINKQLYDEITNRKRMEYEIRFSRFAMDSSTDMILWLDAAGKILYLNKKGQSLLSFSPEEYLSKFLWNIPIAFEPSSWPEFWEGLETNHYHYTQTYFTDPKGRAIPIEILFNYVDYEHHALACCYIRDITERVKATEKLAERGAQLNAILQGSPIPAFVIGKDHRVLFWNRAMEVFTGIPAPDIIGTRRQWSAFYPSERPCLADLLVDSEEQEIKIAFPDFEQSPYIGEAFEGTRFLDLEIGGKWIHATAALIRDSRGSIIGAIESIVDITSEKLIRDALGKIEERLDLAISAANLGVWSYDIASGTVTHNEQWLGMLGFSGQEKEKTGEWWQDRIHPDDRAMVTRVLEEHLSGKKPVFDVIYRVQHKNGEWKWLHSQGRVTSRDPGGRPLRMTGINQDITGIIRAEEKNRTLAEMVDTTPVSITVLDPGGDFLYANERTVDMYGYTQEEFLTMNLRDLDVPESRQQIESRMKKLLESGELEFDAAHYRKDGSTIPVHVHAKMTRWGRRDAILSLASDISERKRMEEHLQASYTALKESQDQYKMLVEVNHDIVYSTDENAVLTYISPQVWYQLGFSPGEMQGKNVGDFIHPDDRDDMMKDIAANFLKGGICTDQFRVRTRDGRYRWMEEKSSFITDSFGKVTIIGTLRDIHEQKLASDALRESEEKYRILAEASSDWIFMIDRDDRVLYANRAAAEVLGKNPGDIIGKSMKDLLPQEIASGQSDGLAKVFDTGEIFRTETGMNLSGRTYRVDSTFTPLKNNDGEVYAVLGISRVLTEKNQAVDSP